MMWSSSKSNCRSLAALGMTLVCVAGHAAPAAAQNAASPKPQGSTASAAPAADEPVTYTKHIAPILQQKCQVCHQPNSIAPMSLLTYQDAKDYADEIRQYVSSRVMPPWYLDRTVGVHDFKNDRGLSDEQISTIVRWMDSGMPLGKTEDMPPPVKFPDPTGWQFAKTLGEPDLVLKSPPFTMPPQTQDKWFRPVTETGITEPRWVRAIEIRPAGDDGTQGRAPRPHDARAARG